MKANMIFCMENKSCGILFSEIDFCATVILWITLLLQFSKLIFYTVDSCFVQFAVSLKNNSLWHEIVKLLYSSLGQLLSTGYVCV